MVVAISEALFKQIQTYLDSLSDRGDRQAQELLVQIQQEIDDAKHAKHAKPEMLSAALPDRSRSPSLTKTEFTKKLLEIWQVLAQEEIGENFWSYPVLIRDIADEMDIEPETLAHYLTIFEVDRLQLIQTRGHNYTIGKQKAASLTFHPVTPPNERKSQRQEKISRLPNKSENGILIEDDTAFKVGDRVRVNSQRQQYANLCGTVSQVISVSCRVQLDNGWSAFLPNHCLDRIQI
jgi:hypothetical protein